MRQGVCVCVFAKLCTVVIVMTITLHRSEIMNYTEELGQVRHIVKTDAVTKIYILHPTPFSGNLIQYLMWNKEQAERFTIGQFVNVKFTQAGFFRRY